MNIQRISKKIESIPIKHTNSCVNIPYLTKKNNKFQIPQYYLSSSFLKNGILKRLAKFNFLNTKIENTPDKKTSNQNSETLPQTQNNQTQTLTSEDKIILKNQNVPEKIIEDLEKDKEVFEKFNALLLLRNQDNNPIYNPEEAFFIAIEKDPKMQERRATLLKEKDKFNRPIVIGDILFKALNSDQKYKYIKDIITIKKPDSEISLFKYNDLKKIIDNDKMLKNISFLSKIKTSDGKNLYDSVNSYLLFGEDDFFISQLKQLFQLRKKKQISNFKNENIVELAETNEITDDLKKILGLKDRANNFYFNNDNIEYLQKIFNLNNNLLKRYINIVSNYNVDPSMPYFLDVIKTPKFYNNLIEIKENNDFKSGRINMNLALILAEFPEITKLPIFKDILNFKKDKKYFLSSNQIFHFIKNINESMYKENNNLYKCMFDELKEQPKENINDVVLNTEAYLFLGIDNLKELLKLEMFKAPKNLQNFLYSFVSEISNKNFLKTNEINNISDDKEKIKEIRTFFSSCLKLKELKYLNNLPIENELKINLANNIETINIKKFEKVLSYLNSLNQEELKKCDEETISDIITILTLEDDANSLNNNLDLIQKLALLKNTLEQKNITLFNEKITSISNDTTKKLLQIITPSNVERENSAIFFRNFIFNRDNSEEILSSEKMKNYLSKKGKSGIEIKYSRKNFLEDLNKTLENISNKEREIILEKIGIECPEKSATEIKMQEFKKPKSTFINIQLMQNKEDIEIDTKDKKQTPIKLFINKEEQNYIQFSDTQKGSNTANIIKNKDNEYFYAKFHDNLESARQEILASELYKEAGILTPDFLLFKDTKGNFGIKSKIITNITTDQNKETINSFKEGLAVDMWLANWDVLKNENTQNIKSLNTAIRIDVGGSLEYRAQGDMKLKEDFSNKVTSMISIFENNPNNPNLNINAEEFSKSLKRVITIPNKTIEEIVERNNCNQKLAQKLINRKNYLKQVYFYTQKLNAKEKITTTILKEIDSKIKYNIGNKYNGIITNSKLNTNIQIEKEVKNIIDKFIYNNEVITDNKELNESLNQLLRAFPEFINLIGKQTNTENSNTLDIDILKSLHSILNTEEYKSLSKQDKMILKMVVLLRDIAQKESDNNNFHEKDSAFYTRDILKRCKLPSRIKNNIVEIINNHHWFRKIKRNNTQNELMELAVRFRKDNTLKIANIIATQDIKKNSNKAKSELELLNKTIKQIEELQKEIHSKIGFSYTTEINHNILNKKTKSEYKINGQTYNISVINLSGKEMPQTISGIFINDNTNLLEYGFYNDGNTPVYKKDLKFLTHSTDTPLDLYYLSDVLSEGNICASNITLEKKALYSHKNGVGVILSPKEQSSIGTSWHSNQASGYHKDINNFIQEIFPESNNYSDIKKIMLKREFTTFRRNMLIKYLNSKNIQISDEDYIIIHKYLCKHKFLSHVHNVPLTNGKILKEKDLKEAINFADEKIREKASENHNETNILTPDVIALYATQNSINKVPLEFIKIAEKLNIPILLLGESE